MISDKNGKEIVLQDYVANEVVGVQIGTEGHKLWICIDGVAVLRVKSPLIHVEDMRNESARDLREYDTIPAGAD